jgi:hypothetical protein
MTNLKIALLGAVRELAAVELPSVTSVLTGRPRLDRTVERVVTHAEALTALLEELRLRGVLSPGGA